MQGKTVMKTIVTRAAGATLANNSVKMAFFNADGTEKIIPDRAAAQADSTATTVAEMKTDFNALLAKLRAANILAP